MKAARAFAAALLFAGLGLSGCSSHRTPLPYRTDWEQFREPFPGDAIDTTGAVFVPAGTPMPQIAIPADGKPLIRSLDASRVRVDYYLPTGRAYWINIIRGETPAQERLIKIAEVTYPLREALPLEARIFPIPRRKHLWTLAPEGRVDEPYALTMDALRHFLTISERHGRGTALHGEPANDSYQLTYVARVEHQPSVTYGHKEYRDVSVVHLRLGWSCRTAQADLWRTVLLNRSDQVVAVFGDGHAHAEERAGERPPWSTQ